jgi:hypothetical protein
MIVKKLEEDSIVVKISLEDSLQTVKEVISKPETLNKREDSPEPELSL